eukprot:gnl/MRDRNA2_/MRDRNA2_160774_c0_seq1.p1 gnl/MRDRNA2_/MRDRNA2_160774_c0~~gnl/MRDRNA2_/MRDRNA2_160774_c0_seq1.p1  ORF type:complete len:476 (-),score=77.54 gnl/MRDRNA2_/MRDRNA2_160774_c0_seq1:33-1460(-)
MWNCLKIILLAFAAHSHAKEIMHGGMRFPIANLHKGVTRLRMPWRPEIGDLLSASIQSPLSGHTYAVRESIRTNAKKKKKAAESSDNVKAEESSPTSPKSATPLESRMYTFEGPEFKDSTRLPSRDDALQGTTTSRPLLSTLGSSDDNSLEASTSQSPVSNSQDVILQDPGKVESRQANSMAKLREQELELKNLVNAQKDARIQDQARVDQAINDLESACEPPNLNTLRGTKWRLVYSNDDVTRSSPFFWAFRKALGRGTLGQGSKILDDALNVNTIEAIFELTDGLPFQERGDAIQTFEADSLISQVRLTIDLFGSGLVTTTSQWSPMVNNPSTIQLKVQTTQVIESTPTTPSGVSLIAPFTSLIESTLFPSGEALELATPGSSTVLADVTYLSDTMRITRNEAGKVFVFERLQNSPNTLSLAQESVRFIGTSTAVLMGSGFALFSTFIMTLYGVCRGTLAVDATPLLATIVEE